MSPLRRGVAGVVNHGSTILALLVATSGMAAGAEETPADVSLIPRVEASILVPRLWYPTDQPITVRLSLRNPARVPVELPEICFTTASLRLERLTDHKALSPRGRMRRPDSLKLLPGAGFDDDLDLRDLFHDVNQPGAHRIMWRCGEWESPSYEFFVATPYDRKRDRAALITTDVGSLEIVLMPEQAPEHVRSFVELARSGYYDGVPFYRILRGVMAETGDPRGDGTGGWSQQMTPEIDPDIVPGKGLVGAVRRDTSMTSESLFFFLLSPQPSFQGKQTFFAYVRKGMAVLDALSSVPVDLNEGAGAFRPLEPVRITRIEILGE